MDNQIELGDKLAYVIVISQRESGCNSLNLRNAGTDMIMAALPGVLVWPRCIVDVPIWMDKYAAQRRRQHGSHQ